LKHLDNVFLGTAVEIIDVQDDPIHAWKQSLFLIFVLLTAFQFRIGFFAGVTQKSAELPEIGSHARNKTEVFRVVRALIPLPNVVGETFICTQLFQLRGARGGTLRGGFQITLRSGYLCAEFSLFVAQFFQVLLLFLLNKSALALAGLLNELQRFARPGKKPRQKSANRDQDAG